MSDWSQFVFGGSLAFLWFVNERRRYWKRRAINAERIIHEGTTIQERLRGLTK